jgi:hypothetical protein
LEVHAGTVVVRIAVWFGVILLLASRLVPERVELQAYESALESSAFDDETQSGIGLAGS